VPTEALYHWLFAASVFCRLFDDEPLVGTALAAGDHPRWRYRQRRIVDDVLTFIGHEISEGQFGTRESGEELVFRSLMHAEEAVSRVTGEPLSTQGLSDGNHPSVKAHTELLVKVWNEDLWEILCQYAYVELRR
jgi:hypothetical protein